MEKYNSLNKNGDTNVYGSQVIQPQKQPDDNLEKIMREQLAQLKKSANVSKGNAQSYQNEGQTTQRTKQLRIRSGSSALTQNQQKIKQAQGNEEKRKEYHEDVSIQAQDIALQPKHNQNDKNYGNVNTLRNLKNEKENTRISVGAIAGYNGNIYNKQREEQMMDRNDEKSTNQSSMVHSPSRKRSNYNNYVTGHSFAESRYTSENKTKGSYLFKKLRQKLDENEGYSFYQDNQDKQGSSLQNSSISSVERLNVQSNNSNNRAKNSNINDLKNNSEIGNTYTHVSYNKSTLRSHKKDEYNSIMNSIIEPSIGQNQSIKRTILHKTPLRSSQNGSSNNNNNSSNYGYNSNATYRAGSGLAKNNNFYGQYNGNSKIPLGQKRESNSLNNQYPILMRRNHNNSKATTKDLSRNESRENGNQRYSSIQMQQMKEKQQQQMNHQEEQRKANFFKRQQEMEDLFQTTKEQLYTSQIERMSSVGQHILQQREKYFNQSKNNLSMQLPQRDLEPIPPQITQESLAYATQGSQYMEPYRKMSAYQLLNGDENNKAGIIRKKSQQKKKKKVELVRLSQGENGSIIISGNQERETNVISKCSFDQNAQQDKQNRNVSSVHSSRNCLIKKKVKKINSRYQNQSLKNSVDKSRIDDMLVLESLKNTDLLYSDNSKKDHQSNTFRALQNQADQLDQSNLNSAHQESGMIIYKQKEDDYYFAQQQQSQQQKNGTGASRFTNKKANTSTNNPLSFQDKDDYEDLFDVKLYPDQQSSGLFKLQSYPLIESDQKPASKENQHENKQLVEVKIDDDSDDEGDDSEEEDGSDEDDDDGSDDEGDSDGEQQKETNKSDIKNRSNQKESRNNTIQKSNHSTIRPHYVVGQLSDAINPEIQNGEKRKIKNIDNYFNRKYNIDISVDEGLQLTSRSPSKKKRRQSKKSKRRRNKKNKAKVVLVGANNKKYKIKVYKNIMGIYCAHKEDVQKPEKKIIIIRRQVV